jgi:hypothetical protein
MEETASRCGGGGVVIANILTKLGETGGECWLCSLVVGHGANIPHRKNYDVDFTNVAKRL